MGEKLPVISGKDLLNCYLKCGCELKRVKGRMFVIPVHSNEEIDRGLLKAIIRQSGIEVEQFTSLCKNKQEHLRDRHLLRSLSIEPLYYI